MTFQKIIIIIIIIIIITCFYLTTPTTPRLKHRSITEYLVDTEFEKELVKTFVVWFNSPGMMEKTKKSLNHDDLPLVETWTPLAGSLCMVLCVFVCVPQANNSIDLEYKQS